MGLDDPIALQVWHFVSGAVQGDLGPDFVQSVPVTSLIGPDARSQRRAVAETVAGAMGAESPWPEGVTYQGALPVGDRR